MVMQREIDRQGGFSPAFSGGLEGHAADKASQQAFTRQSSGSPARSVQDQQPTKVTLTPASWLSCCLTAWATSTSQYKAVDVLINTQPADNHVHV